MSIRRRKSRREKILENKDEEFVYSKEEEEYLGLSSLKSSSEDEEYDDDNDDDDNDDDDDDDEEYLEEENEEENEEEEVELSLKQKRSNKIGGKPLASKERFYVEPKDFDNEIVNYYNSDVISDNLAQMISKIAHKLSYASNFVNYTYREEMVGDGIVRMFKALISKKYDREKGTNPFSYFTRIAFNAFRNRIKKEKHVRAVHEKYQEELMMFSSNYNNLMKNNQISIQKDRRKNE